MKNLCMNCGQQEISHIGDLCPRISTNVVIDADQLRRVKETGHPRLLKNLLLGVAKGFTDVAITSLIVSD